MQKWLRAGPDSSYLLYHTLHASPSKGFSRAGLSKPAHLRRWTARKSSVMERLAVTTTATLGWRGRGWGGGGGWGGVVWGPCSLTVKTLSFCYSCFIVHAALVHCPSLVAQPGSAACSFKCAQQRISPTSAANISNS